MKNVIEILETRKDEIIDLTLELLPEALSGDNANSSFYIEVDEETGKLTVDYFYYLGNVMLNDNHFYTIPVNEIPSPEDFGYESIDDIDFADCGYREEIERKIEQHIWNLENR